ncbi:hypothetical protein FN846DRAFT_406632 [Sphaerosporella brunnea]|uniref:Uncharacterized protein n=1 Tax=Sphaerosporella brunnea TaxID=1250544 RepID=A0A5J5EI18_9PEZI|nr:hypothetical protein FN846DRAFT_406632 [Sphaerosporella brunnea]
MYNLHMCALLGDASGSGIVVGRGRGEKGRAGTKTGHHHHNLCFSSPLSYGALCPNSMSVGGKKRAWYDVDRRLGDSWKWFATWKWCGGDCNGEGRNRLKGPKVLAYKGVTDRFRNKGAGRGSEVTRGTVHEIQDADLNQDTPIDIRRFSEEERKANNKAEARPLYIAHVTAAPRTTW